MDEISKIGEKTDALKPELAMAANIPEPPKEAPAAPKEAPAAEAKDTVQLSPDALKAQELNQ